MHVVLQDGYLLKDGTQQSLHDNIYIHIYVYIMFITYITYMHRFGCSVVGTAASEGNNARKIENKKNHNPIVRTGMASHPRESYSNSSISASGWDPMITSNPYAFWLVPVRDPTFLWVSAEPVAQIYGSFVLLTQKNHLVCQKMWKCLLWSSQAWAPMFLGSSWRN